MSHSVREAMFPDEITVDPDKDTRAIFVHVNESLLASQSLVESYHQVNDLYESDREDVLRFMAQSVFPMDSGLDSAFLHSHKDIRCKDLYIAFSPLNDGRPESSPSMVMQAISGDDASRRDVNRAQPNSWRPIAKLYCDYELGHAENLGMPRLQAFAPEAPAMTSKQRRRVASGDMTPYGELIVPAIEIAERTMHETYGTDGFDKIHFFAAGMGAKALGAAVSLIESTDRQVGSVTLMNFALGEQSLAKLGRDYTGRRMVGEPSELVLPRDYVRVPEFTVLKDLDKYTEFAMRIRQAKALVNISLVRSLMNARRGVGYIEQLLENGSTLTIANGHNEAMVAQTDHYLPMGDSGLHRIDIVGVDGKKVGQAANEHGAALALVSNLGIYNYLINKSK